MTQRVANYMAAFCSVWLSLFVLYGFISFEQIRSPFFLLTLAILKDP